MHLDLAAGAFLTIPPDTYLMTQVCVSCRTALPQGVLITGGLISGVDLVDSL